MNGVSLLFERTSSVEKVIERCKASDFFLDYCRYQMLFVFRSVGLVSEIGEKSESS